MKTLTKTNGIGKDGKDAAQAASLKVEELLQVQQKQLEGVRSGIAEDISKIRESVQGMISEALIKRASAHDKRKKAPTGKNSADLSSDGGVNSGLEQSAQKTKEREKMERQIIELESTLREEVALLRERNTEKELELETSK